jgi:hypothetical protein
MQPTDRNKSRRVLQLNKAIRLSNRIERSLPLLLAASSTAIMIAIEPAWSACCGNSNVATQRSRISSRSIWEPLAEPPFPAATFCDVFNAL